MFTLVIVLSQSACSTFGRIHSLNDSDTDRSPNMHLGHFSISLAVKDLHASRAFYEKLGF